MHKSPVSKIRCGLAAAAAVISIFSSPSAHAANSTWLPAPTTADWGTDGNWVSGTAAGALGTLNNADTATFLTNTNGNGTTTPVVIDLGRNIKNLFFGSSSVLPASFTVGTTGGNSLQLSSSGSLSLIGGGAGTNSTVTVNAPLVLEGASTTTAGTYNFSNSHASATNKLVIGGAVSGGTTTAGITLTLTGANGGANEVSGIISDGGAVGGLGIAKTNTGLWILSGSNTYTGGTTLTAGTLSVSSTANLGAATSGVTFAGGILQITGTTMTTLGHTATFNAATNATFDINNAANVFTLDQNLNATSGLTKIGVGTLNVNQATNYSGTTSATAGTLRLSSANSSAGAININGATLQLNNASNGGLASGTITLNNAAILSLLANQSISNNALINGTTTFSGTNNLTLNGSITNNTGNRSLANSIATGESLTLAGNIYLSEVAGTGRTLTISGIGTTVLSGTIADFNGVGGTGGTLFLNGTGTTTITGMNTYSGGTIIAAGSGPGASVVVTSIGNVGGAGSNLGTGGVLTIGNGVNNGKLVYTGTGEVTDRVVNLGGSTGAAILDQSGASGLLKFTSNFTATGAGTKLLTLQGSTAGAGEIDGAIVDNSGANITSILKVGTGTWTLGGANTYSGATTINGGALVVTSTSGLGVNTAANAVTISTAALSLLNNGAGNNGTIVYGPGSGYNVTTSGNTSAITINVGNNSANTGNTIQLGSLALTSASLTLTNSNGYNLNFSGSTTMTGSRTITNNMASGTSTFASFTSLDAAARIVTFSGTSTTAVTSVGAISQNGANALNVTQASVGTLVLTGNSTYSGTTGVAAGTLLVNGTHTGGGAYSVGAAGELGGNGSITAASLTAAAGAKLSPGGDGALGHNLTFALAGGMDLHLASNDTGAYIFDLGSVSTSDKITLTSGTLNVGTLDFADFNFTAVAGFGAGTYILFDAASAITGTVGTASGLVGGLDATLSIDGVNNDVLLTVVPEPNTLILMAAGVCVLGYLKRIRRTAVSFKG